MPIQEGWLDKKGHKFKNWHRRWFVLEPHRLAYYEDDKKEVQKGSYVLEVTATIARLPDEGSMKYVFKLNAKGSGGNELIMSASTSTEQDTWIANITGTICHSDPQSSMIPAPVSRYLDPLGWPKGMQQTLLRTCQTSPLRFFIVDDSGSMGIADGHQIIGSGTSKRIVECSRWTELANAIRFHANFAHCAEAATEFRLLNGSAPMVIGQPGAPDQSAQRLSMLSTLLDGSPNGGTPLCYHIREVINEIAIAAPQLRSNNQRAVVVIATDGESSDGSMAEAMAPLKHLPVQVVVRLCTDDDKICDYWNNIDKELELGMDILDDLKGEAEEIAENNNWLVYGEPLHRLREWGIIIKEFDLLDEAKLSSEQMQALCAHLLFGGNPKELPHPDLDWKEFENFIKSECERSPATWNPISKRYESWINFYNLERAYNKKSGGCIIS